MKTVSLVLHEFDESLEGDVIGVDYGAYVCASRGIPMMIACGDFDSVTGDEFKCIEKHAEKIIRLKPEKDETDFTYAYSLCVDYDRINVFGGLGGRRDHEYMHILTVCSDPRLYLYDKQNKIYSLGVGKHVIKKDTYQYVSMHILDKGNLSFEGVKYPLNNQEVKVGDTYLTSNEILEEEATLTIHSGKVLLLQTNP